MCGSVERHVQPTRLVSAHSDDRAARQVDLAINEQQGLYIDDRVGIPVDCNRDDAIRLGNRCVRNRVAIKGNRIVTCAAVDRVITTAGGTDDKQVVAIVTAEYVVSGTSN